MTYFTGQLLLNNLVTGLIPAIPLAFLIGSFVKHKHKEIRDRFLHPTPHIYKVPVKQVFPTLKKALAEFVSSEGKEFRIKPGNPNQFKEIIASMIWSDMDEVPKPTDLDPGRKEKEKVDRHIRLVVCFRAQENESTLVEIQWHPIAQGLHPFACDSIIQEANAAIKKALDTYGEGTAQEKDLEPWVPSKCLSSATSVCMIIFSISAFFNMGNHWIEANELEKKATERKLASDEKLLSLEKDIEKWNAFKMKPRRKRISFNQKHKSRSYFHKPFPTSQYDFEVDSLNKNGISKVDTRVTPYFNTLFNEGLSK